MEPIDVVRRMYAAANGRDLDAEQLLREAARRAGAAVQMYGACIMPGDTLVFGFAVVEDANGVVSFGARNGALCLRVREA